MMLQQDPHALQRLLVEAMVPQQVRQQVSFQCCPSCCMQAAQSEQHHIDSAVPFVPDRTQDTAEQHAEASQMHAQPVH